MLKTTNFPLLYYHMDWKNIIRDYFEQVFLFYFLALQLTIGAPFPETWKQISFEKTQDIFSEFPFPEV